MGIIIRPHLIQFAITPERHAEIDAILRQSEREIRSGKRDLDKEGMSVEEYRKKQREAWERTEG